MFIDKELDKEYDIKRNEQHLPIAKKKKKWFYIRDILWLSWKKKKPVVEWYVQVLMS